MKKVLKAKLRLVAIAFATVLMCVCAAFAGVTLAGTQSASAMTATSVANVYGGADIWNSTSGKFDKKGVQDLLVKLGKGAGATTDTKSYKALENQFSSPVNATTLGSKNSGANGLVVMFGGYKWTVTYLSKNTDGELIATLWYADTETKSVFAGNASGTGWYSDTTGGGYSGYKYSNHYGASYIRAVTLGNGGSFWSASSNGVTDGSVSAATATTAQIQASKFYKFAKGEIAEYLTAPAQVSWQQVEYNSAFSSNRLQNDNLTAQTANWYSTNISNSTKNDPYYYQWSGDKIWLPSIPETGWNASNTGIWGTTTEQRKSTASYSWLRSGGNNHAGGAYRLGTSGDYDGADTNNSCGVRPALHLNLKSAAKAAGVSVPAETSGTKTYTGTAISSIENIEADKVDLKNGKFTNVTNTPAGTTWTPTVSANGEIGATAAGDYEVTFSLKNTYAYSDVEWNADEETWVHKSLKDPADATLPLVVPVWDYDGLGITSAEAQTEAGYEKMIADHTVSFKVNRARITATWSGGPNYEYTYSGSAQSPAPTLAGEKNGEKVVLVTDYQNNKTGNWGSAETVNSGNYVKRIKLDSPASSAVNANYVLYDGTAEVESLTQTYSIAATFLTVKWTGENGSTTDFSWVFDKTAHAPVAKAYMPDGTTEATTAVLGYTYALQTGKQGTLESDGGAPLHKGDYVATVALTSDAANDNFAFKSGATLTQNFAITPLSAQNLQWWQNSAFNVPWGSGISYTYDNAAHRPYATAQDIDGNALAMSFTYQKVESGSLVGAEFSDTPKAAGTYRITAHEEHHDYTMSGAGTTYIEYTINKLSVAVSWDWSGFTDGANKRTEYNTLAQAPVASAKASNIWADNGSAVGDYTLALTAVIKLGGTVQTGGAINYNASAYNIKVSLSAADANNYTLTGDTENFYIDKHVIQRSEIHWYNGGKEVANPFELTFGAAPAITAKAIFTVGGQAYEIDLIADGNGYNKQPSNANDVWPMANDYTYTAKLKTADAANFTADAKDFVLSFAIVAARVQAEEMSVVWAISDGAGGYTAISANYKFTYNGNVQYPLALGYFIKDQDTNPFDITDVSTFKIIDTVGTVYRDAGVYTAWAKPTDSNADISFFVADGSDVIVYEIAALEVEVEWTVATAGYTYTGLPQGPTLAATANGVAALGSLRTNFVSLLKVTQATDAGDQVARASAGKNYTLKLAGETAEETLYKAFYINKLKLNSLIVWETGADKDEFVYDGADHEPAYTLDPKYSALKVVLTGKQSQAGTYYINAALANDPVNRNYELASSNAVKSFTVKPQEVTAVWTDGATDTFVYGYNGAKHEPTATIAPVTLADAASTVINFTVTVTGGETDAGNYVAKAAVADKNFVIANDEQAFEIEKAAITVTATDKTVNYGASAPLYTASASGAIASTDSASALVKGVQFRCAYDKFSEVKTGGYTITPYGLELKNYTVTYVAGTLTVNKATVAVSVDAHTGVYGEHFHEPTYTATGVLNGDSLGLAFEIWETDASGAATQKVADLSAVPVAGTYLIKAVITGVNPNYDVGTVADGTYTINKKALVVTADNAAVEYGDAAPAYTVTVTGLVNGDTAPAFAATSDYDPADPANNAAGAYAIAVTPMTLANYTVATADYNDGTLTVAAKKITVQIASQSAVYGGTAVDLTAAGCWNVTAGALVNGDTDADLGVTLKKENSGLNGSTAVTGNAVGVYDITGKATNTNYNVEFKDGIYVITKATLTVTADDKTITYGDAKPTGFTVTYNGFVNGDSETSLGVWLAGKGTVKYNCPYTAGSGVGTYLITPYALEAVNYNVEFEAGDLTVGVLAIDLAIDNASSVYGQPEANLTWRISNGSVYGSDNLGIVLTKDAAGLAPDGVTAVSGMEVGTYDITGTASNPNYKVTFTNKGVYTVKKATLVITANANTITYGDANVSDSWANGISYGGFVDGEDETTVTFGGTLAYTYSYTLYGNVGAYTITPAGLTADNYDITFENGALTVVARAVTVTIDDKTSMYGTAEVALTSDAASVAVNNDDLKITLTRGRNTVKDAGAYSITGTYNNANYAVTFVNGTYTITPFEIDVVWDSGNTDPADYTYAYNGNEQCPAATFVDWDGNVKKLTVSGGRTRTGVNFVAEVVLPSPVSNFVFKTGTDVQKLFAVTPKTISIEWYKDYDAATDTYTGLISASNPCQYTFKSGVKQAPYAKVLGVIAGDVVEITVYGSEVAAGSYTANAVITNMSTGDGGNYEIGSASKTCDFAIVKMSASGYAWYETLSSTNAVVSGNLTYTYDGYAHQPWVKSGVNDEYNYKITKADGTDCGGVALNAGSYKIVATPINSNITITAQQATFVFAIEAVAVSVVWSADTFEYNGGVQVPTATFTDVFGNDIILAVTVDGGNANSVNAATYTANVSLPTTGNYKFASGYTAQESYDITAKQIEVTWTSNISGNAWVMEYNGTTVDTTMISASASMTNAVAGESVSLKHTLLLNGKAVNEIKDAGVYTIKVELVTANGNYEVIDDEHAFEITKPVLTITADDKHIQYGDPKPVFTAQYQGFIAGETEVSLGLEVNGEINWLYSEYTQNSSPRDEGYAITLVTMEQDPAARKAFEEILKNYDWADHFVAGLITIAVVDGDVKLIGTYNSSGDIIYSGEASLPEAYYKSSKSGSEWVELKVTLMADDSYTTEATAPAVNVGKYYIKVSKYDGDTDQTNLTQTEWVFEIKKLQITVNIHDNENEVYGKVTSGNYASKLVWEYDTLEHVKNEELKTNLADNNLLGIELEVNLTFDDGGFANADTYHILGKWDDATYGDNFSVKFVGSAEASDGTNSEGLFVIAKAVLQVVPETAPNQISKLTGDPIYVDIAKLNENKETVDEYKYEHIRNAGYYDATATIVYKRYNLESYNAEDIPSPEDEAANKYEITNNPFQQVVGKWLVNYKLEMPNHEVCYGQWIIYIEPMLGEITVTFVKEYTVQYGDAAVTGKELTAKLLDEGYIEIDGILEKADFVKYATAKVAYNKDLSLANVGAYNVEFEFDEIPNSTVIYEAEYKNSTNVGAYVVNPRLLTVDWGTTDFVYDGSVKLSTLKPKLTGWINGGTLEIEGLETSSVKTFTFSDTGVNEIKITVTAEEKYDFVKTGGHQLTVRVDNGNYTLDIDNAAKTVSISLDGDPVVGGLPAWLFWLLVGVAAVLAIGLIIFIIIAAKRRGGTSDSDGFYEKADEAEATA